MQKLNKNEVGLVLGAVTALAHLVWLILVGAGLAQGLLDWILDLHRIEPVFTVMPFAWGQAILLLIVTAVVGYVVGWVLAAVWNSLRRS